MSRRDAELPLAEMRRKLNPAALENALERHINIFKHSPQSVPQYMEGGTLADLALFSRRNTAVTGYVMNSVFAGLRGLVTDSGESAHIALPWDCTLYVSIKTDNFASTEDTFYSNEETVIDSARDTTTISKKWTGYGANFDVAVTMEFRPVNAVAQDPRTVTLKFAQSVVIPPDRNRNYEYTATHFNPPSAQEFKVGAVLNLLHDDKMLDETKLRAMVTLLEEIDVFSRRNKAVWEIERALEQLGSFVDMIVLYLARLSPFYAATARQSKVAMPWGPARDEIEAAVDDAAADGPPRKKEAPEEDAAMDDGSGGDATSYIGSLLGRALDAFLSDQCEELDGNMGVLGSLMQRLSLLKTYATHFRRCYASIDHYMVRSFMNSIGDHALLFEQGSSLDTLLNKIAMFQASRDEIQMTSAEIDVIGCSVDVQVKLPGKAYFEPLMGIPSVDEQFEGKLCFTSGKPIPVTGECTRQLFVLPTESDGNATTKPQMQVVARTEFMNPPVVVIIGTPDGSCTNVKATFLLVNTWCMQMAIEVGALPSNKKFAEAVSILPPEMADFAQAIRDCDIAGSGLDLQVVPLRPLLASALGIKEDDLAGDFEWVTKLVKLMRGGTSLQSIAQDLDQRPSSDGDKEGFEDVRPPKSDLALMKERTDRLLDEMFEQGMRDHGTTHLKHPPPDDDDGAFGGQRYRSLSAAAPLAAGVRGPRGGSRAAAAAAATAAAAAAAATAAAAAAGPAAGGDASVQNLTNAVKNLKTDDRDFMRAVLKRCETRLSNSEAVLGAVLTIPNCATQCKFAKGKVPDNITQSDFIAPGAGDTWDVRPNLDAASKTIRRMLAAHAKLGGTVPTTRLTVFGVFVEWETNLLSGLMGGSKNPTKIIAETISTLAPLQTE